MNSPPTPPDDMMAPSPLPFYAAGMALGVAAVAAVAFLFTRPAHGLGATAQAAFFAIGAMLLLAAAWTFVWPARLRFLTAPLQELPSAFMDARTHLTDIQSIRKEYTKVRQDIEGFSDLVRATLERSDATLKETAELIRQAEAAVAQSVNDRRKAEDEKMELRRSVGDARREAEEWQKAALKLSGTLELTSSTEGGLSDAYAEAAASFSRAFERAFQPLGLSLIRPAVGDPFDAAIHEFAGQMETAAASEGTVAACESWGHVTRAQGVRTKARVLVAKPPVARVLVAKPPVPHEPVTGREGPSDGSASDGQPAGEAPAENPVAVSGAE